MTHMFHIVFLNLHHTQAKMKTSMLLKIKCIKNFTFKLFDDYLTA